MKRYFLYLVVLAALLAGSVVPSQAQSDNSNDDASLFNDLGQLKGYCPDNHISPKKRRQLRHYLRRGNWAYFHKAYNKATNYYSNASIADTDYYKTMYNNGNAFYKEHSFAKAAQYYSKVLSCPDLRGKQRAFAFYNLGNCQVQKALQQRQDLRRSIRTGRMSDQTNDGGMEQLKQAISNYQECLKINPSDMKAKYNLSYAQKLLSQMASSASSSSGGKGQDGQNGQNGQQDSQGQQGQEGGQHGNTGHDTGKGGPDGTGPSNSGMKGKNPQGQGKGQQNQNGKLGNKGPQSDQDGEDGDGDGKNHGKGNGDGDRDADGFGNGHGTRDAIDHEQMRKERIEKDRKKREAEQLLNAMKNNELNTMKSQIKARNQGKGKTEKDW